MQQFHKSSPSRHLLPGSTQIADEQLPLRSDDEMDEASHTAERTRLRQGIMHVRIDHFYCTMEELLDPSLRGQSFLVGTGTGRPNEPGRVIDVSPAAAH